MALRFFDNEGAILASLEPYAKRPIVVNGGDHAGHTALSTQRGTRSLNVGKTQLQLCKNARGARRHPSDQTGSAVKVRSQGAAHETSGGGSAIRSRVVPGGDGAGAGTGVDAAELHVHCPRRRTPPGKICLPPPSRFATGSRCHSRRVEYRVGGVGRPPSTAAFSVVYWCVSALVAAGCCRGPVVVAARALINQQGSV